jgi:5-methylcytosine-specific restriction endonuclease McrA
VTAQPLVACEHAATSTKSNGPHIEERCDDCGAHIRFVPKRELKLEPRTVTSRPGIKPKVRARILDRFGHSCMSCGASPPDVLLQIDHVIPVELAKRYGVYDDLIEDDLNLAPFCEECNLGKGATVFSARSIRLMHRCLVVAHKREAE